MQLHMNTTTELEKQAIQAAQDQLWDAAVKINKKILDTEPQNISALNRLGFCYLQLQSPIKAKNMYNAVLHIDPYNAIALKYSAIKRTSQFAPPANNGGDDFIEEPGKTKTIALCRVAEQSILDSVAVISEVQLVQKNHCIAVETMKGKYIGTLPDDISFRLKKLIKGGNQYKTIIRSIGKGQCSVFIKELKRSKKFQFTASFPSAIMSTTSTLHENLLVHDHDLDIEPLVDDDTPPQDDDTDLSET